MRAPAREVADELEELFAKRPPSPRRAFTIWPAARCRKASGCTSAGGNGTGLLLIIDASRVLHLNATACDYAWLYLRGLGEAELLEARPQGYPRGPQAGGRRLGGHPRNLDAMLGDSAVRPITFLD